MMFDGDMLIVDVLCEVKNVVASCTAYSIRFWAMRSRIFVKVVYASLLPREYASLDGEAITREDGRRLENRLAEKVWFI